MADTGGPFAPWAGPPPERRRAAKVEIAYRLPGAGWKRRTMARGAKFEALMERLHDEGAEVRTRPAEDGSDDLQ